MLFFHYSGVKTIETIKKVIAYMTLGIDVSKLFPEMVMVSLVFLSMIRVVFSLANI